jgi:competence protein ComEC
MSEAVPWRPPGANTSRGARVALWDGREVVALILASLVAGLAKTPYAAFHFHRLTPYGLIAMPFGFKGLFWRLMGDGIDWMIGVALFVAKLPGAVGRMAAFGVGPLRSAPADCSYFAC